MNRKTFLHARQSSIPQALGLCATDAPGLARYINEAQERLVIAGGETGWYGTWQKVVFQVDPKDPYITLPRQVARIINLAVCNFPVRVQNEFYEFLESGIGLQPPGCCSEPSPCVPLEMYDRGIVPLFRDLDASDGSRKLRFHIASERDLGRKVLVQGVDANGNTVRTLANGVDVVGEYVTLASPFADTSHSYTQITGLQKEVTAGDVRVHEVNEATGEQRLLSILEPSETVAAYRRYYINGMCNTCCQQASGSSQVVAPGNKAHVTAMCKLEFIPVSVDSDYLLIGNLSALKHECMAIRYEMSDSPNALAMAAAKHREAIRLLNQELTHYMGRERPAVNFAPWGAARLEHRAIGTLI